jgi:hypothetical protein
MLDVLGIKNAAKLVPMEDDQKPTDPVTENMNVLRGKPLKAFIYQDHEAHIKVHMSAMQDPKIQQILQMNPAAPQLQAAMLAHINEHLGYAYRQQIEEMIGAPIPYSEEDDVKLPPEVELQLSRLAADASMKLLQRNKTEIAAQQAQQAAQDPVIQMQQQELQMQAKELELKEKKLMADTAEKADRLQIERDRITSQERIAGLNASIKVQTDDKNRTAEQEMEGVRMGMQIAKEMSMKGE